MSAATPRHPDPTDEELVRRVNAGGDGAARAFAVLYVRHSAFAHRVAWRFAGGDEQIAADAVQEAFLWLLSKFPGFELRGRMTSVLYPVTKHAALAMVRTKRRTASGDRIEPAVVVPEGSDEVTRAPLAAIEALPVEQREPVLMRHADGMSIPEIAAALGVAEGTVKSRIHHAIRKLREDAGLRGAAGE